MKALELILCELCILSLLESKEWKKSCFLLFVLIRELSRVFCRCDSFPHWKMQWNGWDLKSSWISVCNMRKCEREMSEFEKALSNVRIFFIFLSKLFSFEKMSLIWELKRMCVYVKFSYDASANKVRNYVVEYRASG